MVLWSVCEVCIFSERILGRDELKIGHGILGNLYKSSHWRIMVK